MQHRKLECLWRPPALIDLSVRPSVRPSVHLTNLCILPPSFHASIHRCMHLPSISAGMEGIHPYVHVFTTPVPSWNASE
eukprot:363037-Chlamydomonas_euryale.AAC.3